MWHQCHLNYGWKYFTAECKWESPLENWFESHHPRFGVPVNPIPIQGDAPAYKSRGDHEKLSPKCCFDPDILCLQMASAVWARLLCQNKEMKLILPDQPLLNSHWLQTTIFPLQRLINHLLESHFQILAIYPTHKSEFEGDVPSSSFYRKCCARIFTWTTGLTEAMTPMGKSG